MSGSIKEQVITFIGKENIELYGKNYLVDHYKLKSKNQDLPNDKKLYNKTKKYIYKKYPKHSAYRSGLLVQEYKKRFSKKWFFDY